MLVRNPWGISVLVGLLAAAVLWLVAQPLAGAANDTDAATTVLYFDRIVHGQRLEAFLPTTPKPLLTVVYGLAWSLTGDWRTLTVLSVGAGAAVVAMAARLAARLGGVGAAAIVVVGLLAWPDFGLEVARANSLIWGLALWLLAGVLITADRPRPWLAGAALALAGLARTETIWLLGAAVLCAAWVGLRALRGGDRTQLRTVLPLLLGTLSIPVACLHDLLLTGRPLYWLGVPGGYTAVVYPDMQSVSPLESIRKELVYYAPAAALLVLALVGGVWLIATRRRAVALALASLAGGVLATLILLAWRAVFISTRYYEEASAAILLAAAVGAAASIGWAAERGARRLAGPAAWPAERLAGPAAWPAGRLAGPAAGRTAVEPAASKPQGGARRRALAPGAIAAALALGVVAVDVPMGTVDPQVGPSRAAYAALEARIAYLSPILADAGGATVALSGANYPVTDPTACRVFVPRQLIAIISMETGAPITALGDSYLAFREGSYPLKPGQWVLHITAADLPPGASPGVFAPFEVSSPITLVAADGQRVSVVPVLADPEHGFWLDRIDEASAS
jgi:hypothetical protein